jgi:hypothetical protein
MFEETALRDREEEAYKEDTLPDHYELRGRSRLAQKQTSCPIHPWWNEATMLHAQASELITVG